MGSIFSQIIAGDIPCHRIHEDDDFLAFMDIRPMSPGHTLVIPKLEIDRFFDLPTDCLAKIMVFAKPIASAIEHVVPCERVGIMVAGLEVPHAHVHLVPIRTIHDLNFANARAADSEQLSRLAHQIREVLNA